MALRSRLPLVLATALVAAGGAFAAWRFREGRAGPPAGESWSDRIDLADAASHSVAFHVYAPRARAGERLPVIVFLQGWNSGGPPPAAWMAWADEHRFAIVAPGFFSTEQEFTAGQSYHFPQVWSGDAFDRILRLVAERSPVDPDQLYLFGFSAGAQFVHRYALLHPARCRVVAAHAAGGYTLPEVGVPTRFLITVGTGDAQRVSGAQDFVSRARSLGIDAELRLVPGLGHALVQEQIDASWARFLEARAAGR